MVPTGASVSRQRLGTAELSRYSPGSAAEQGIHRLKLIRNMIRNERQKTVLLSYVQNHLNAKSKQLQRESAKLCATSDEIVAKSKKMRGHCDG